MQVVPETVESCICAFFCYPVLWGVSVYTHRSFPLAGESVGRGGDWYCQGGYKAPGRWGLGPVRLVLRGTASTSLSYVEHFFAIFFTGRLLERVAYSLNSVRLVLRGTSSTWLTYVEH